MQPLPRLLAIVALCLATTGVAHAASVQRVDIVGLDEPMTDNVRVSLSLVEALGKDLSDRRLEYLLREAEAETREALQPFGYYSPQVTVERTDGTGIIAVTITVTAGEPVRVRNSDIAIEGDADNDRYLNAELDAFRPQPGTVFQHPVYEASKARITRRLAERGYFDADFTQRRVEVTRAEHAADIMLHWDSGDRYDMGAITFVQEPRRIIREDLLNELIYWEQGEYYHQGRLDRLRKSLAELDYFSRINIEPQPEQAIEGRVPVQVTLTPAKRSIYTAGVSYGTDSGAGIRLGFERRYLNDRGHKALAQLDYAQRRKTLTLQYRIPAFAWLDGWYTASLQAADEQTDYIDTRSVEFVVSRSGEINRHLTAIASLHTLRERWAYDYEDDDDPSTPFLYRYATLIFPSLHAEYIDADNRLYPRDALGGELLLRGAVEGVGSDASFAQVHLRANWFKGLNDSDRLIVRGELGHTFTDTLDQIPPGLRFYAGGDRSIRGYQWREVGPRVNASPGLNAFALGARNVVTASVEYEHYFGGGPWGMAAFVDSGSAFDDTPDWHTGIGLGVRWRSPVGPVRIDIAHGLDDPDSAVTLHINIGADL